MAQFYNYGTSEHEPRCDPAASTATFATSFEILQKLADFFFLKSLVAEQAAHKKKKKDTVEDKLLKKLRQELKGHRVCITTFLLESVSFMESTSDLYNVAILVLG